MSTVPGTSGPPVIRDFFANWVNLYGAPPEADYTSGVGAALVASNPDPKPNPYI